jgi:hypothetical protein
MWNYDEKVQRLTKDLESGLTSDFRIDEDTAHLILNHLCKKENISKTVLIWHDHEKTVKRGWLKRKIYGFKDSNESTILGCAYLGFWRTSNKIELFRGGHTISTLLHEIAHLMPNSFGHGKAWPMNFMKLINWFNWLRKEFKNSSCIIYLD